MLSVCCPLLGDESICQVTPSGPLHVCSSLTFKDGPGSRWGIPHPSRLIPPLRVSSTLSGTFLLTSAVTDAVATEGFSRLLKSVSNPHQASVRSVTASAAEGQGLRQLPNVQQHHRAAAGGRHGDHQEMQCRRAELIVKEGTILA